MPVQGPAGAEPPGVTPPRPPWSEFRTNSITGSVVSDGNDLEEEKDGLDDEDRSSCYALAETHPIREWATRVVKHKHFDNMVTFLVLLNCMFLALWLPTEDDDHLLNRISNQAEIVFTILFTVELSLKCVSMGFIVHKGAYLRDAWNRMDFAVVVLSWSAYIPGMGNFLALRTIRLLRPLRTISNNKGMRVLVSVLMNSIPQLLDVFSLWMFVFVVLSIIGMQLWMGRFRRHCVDEVTRILEPEERDMVCGLGRFALRGCDEGYVCEKEDWDGVEYPNPNQGVTNFDNFGWAVLTVFQALSREGWVHMRDLTSGSWSGAANAYWLFLILFGSFFVVNLATAVIFAQFVKVNQEEALNKTKVKRKRKRSVAVELKVGRTDAERNAVYQDDLWPGQKFVLRYAESNWFQNLVVGFIVLNTICLSVEHYKMNDTLKEVLEVANIVFLSFFTAEMVVKLWALGWRGYMHDGWNLFDGLVVVISLVEVFIPSGPGGLSVLRSFRLLRVLKVLRNADNIRRVVAVLVRSVRSVANFSLMISILIFTYALLGMQFFGGRLCEEAQCSDPSFDDQASCEAAEYDPTYNATGLGGGEHPEWVCVRPWRAHFDNAYNAFLTTFQMLTAEGWHDVMFECVGETSWVAVFYFVTLLMVGHYILLNLFTAGIVRNVASEVEKMEQKIREKKSMLKSESKGLSDESLAKISPTAPGMPATPQTPSTISQLNMITAATAVRFVNRTMLSNGSVAAAVESTKQKPAALKTENIPQKPQKGPTGSNRVAPAAGNSGRAIESGGGMSAARAFSLERGLAGSNSQKGTFLERAKADGSIEPINGSAEKGASGGAARGGEEPQHEEGAEDPTLCLLGEDGLMPHVDESGRLYHSLFVFSPQNAFRIVCYRLVNWRHFDTVMIPIIILSSVSLALENPHNVRKTSLTSALEVADQVFTIIFTCEMAVKLVAYGAFRPRRLLNGDPCYTADGWNVLDGFIVVSAWASSFLDSSGLQSLKALRTLRALRPLRMVSKGDGMRHVINALIMVMNDIRNIMVVLALCWLIFAILGVQLFAGKFYSCTDPSRTLGPGYGLEKGRPEDECVGLWYPEEGGAAVEREWKTPRPNFDNLGEAMLSLFELATIEDWPITMHRGMDVTSVGEAPRMEASPLSGLYFVAFTIFGALFSANLLVAAVVNQFMRVKEAGDTSGFLTEPQQAWVDTCRNMLRERPERVPLRPDGRIRKKVFKIVTSRSFDAAIMTCIGLNVLIMLCDHYKANDTYLAVSEVINLTFVGIFALEMVVKLYAFGLREYVADFWNRFDATIVILSIAGAALKFSGTELINTSVIRIFRVFRTARVLRLIKGAKGLRMLLRTFLVSLPALWNIGSLLFIVFFVFAILGMYIMGDAPETGVIVGEARFNNFGNSIFMLFRACTGEGWEEFFHAYIDEGYWASIPFYVVFLCLVYFIMLNLFVAVVLENFTEATRMEEALLTPRHFAQFAEVWARFDHKRTFVMEINNLVPMLKKLQPPLGLKGKDVDKVTMARIIAELDIPNHGNNLIHYQEVLNALAYQVCGERLPVKVQDMVDKATSKAFPGLDDLPEITASFAEVYAAIRFQSAFRGYKMRKDRGARILSAMVIQKCIRGYKARRAMKAKLASQGLDRKVLTPSRVAHLGGANGEGAPGIKSVSASDLRPRTSRQGADSAPGSSSLGSVPTGNAGELIVSRDSLMRASSESSRMPSRKVLFDDDSPMGTGLGKGGPAGGAPAGGGAGDGARTALPEGIAEEGEAPPGEDGGSEEGGAAASDAPLNDSALRYDVDMAAAAPEAGAGGAPNGTGEGASAPRGAEPLAPGGEGRGGGGAAGGSVPPALVPVDDDDEPEGVGRGARRRAASQPPSSSGGVVLAPPDGSSHPAADPRAVVRPATAPGPAGLGEGVDEAFPPGGVDLAALADNPPIPPVPIRSEQLMSRSDDSHSYTSPRDNGDGGESQRSAGGAVTLTSMPEGAGQKVGAKAAPEAPSTGGAWGEVSPAPPPPPPPCADKDDDDFVGVGEEEEGGVREELIPSPPPEGTPENRAPRPHVAG